MKYLLFFLILSVTLSCDFLGERIQGNGNIRSEDRSTDSFTGVDIGGSIHLYVTQGPAYSVRVETDENLMEFIEVRTSGNELHIGQRNNTNLQPSQQIKVYVSTPALSSLGASGASHIYGTNKITATGPFDIDVSGASHLELDLNAPVVEAEASGASYIQVKGETRELRIDGSGSSEIDCPALMAETVYVDVSGATSAEVFASVKLDAHASGASHVKYRGNAAVDKNVSGAGSVSKVKLIRK